jgi:hypothetical protein
MISRARLGLEGVGFFDAGRRGLVTAVRSGFGDGAGMRSDGSEEGGSELLSVWWRCVQKGDLKGLWRVLAASSRRRRFAWGVAMAGVALDEAIMTGICRHGLRKFGGVRWCRRGGGKRASRSTRAITCARVIYSMHTCMCMCADRCRHAFLMLWHVIAIKYTCYIVDYTKKTAWLC